MWREIFQQQRNIGKELRKALKRDKDEKLEDLLQDLRRGTEEMAKLKEPLAKVILKKLAIRYVGAVAPTLPIWGRPGPLPWHFCKRLRSKKINRRVHR